MNLERIQKFLVIGLIAASMLMYEILLTRICALRLFPTLPWSRSGRVQC